MISRHVAVIARPSFTPSMDTFVGLGRLVIDRRRLIINHLTLDQGPHPVEVFVGVIDVGDFDLLTLDEHAEMLADQRDRPVGRGQVAAAHREDGIAAQIAQHPLLVDADPLCRIRYRLIGSALLLLRGARYFLLSKTLKRAILTP
jgi:hypothetical protein